MLLGQKYAFSSSFIENPSPLVMATCHTKNELPSLPRRLGNALAICCCVTNHHKLGLKQHAVVIIEFQWVRDLGTFSLGPLPHALSPGFRQGVSQSWGQHKVPLGQAVLPSSHGCWQNSVPLRAV